MWRPSSLLRHGFHNVTSEVVRSAIIVMLLTCFIGGIAYVDLDLVHSLRWENQQRIVDGVDVVIATSPKAINSTVCENLASQTGFVNSGSLREDRVRVLTTDRSTLIPTGAASIGFLKLLGYASLGALNEPGVLVGEALGDYQAILPGGYVDLVDKTPAKVMGIIPETSRSERISGWVVQIETASGMADQCWAETEPGLRAAGEVVMRALFSGDKVEFTTLLRYEDRPTDLEAWYQSRMGLSLRWALPLALILIAGLITYTRRSEYGLYRALNMNFIHIVFTTQVEWITYTVLGSILGIATAVIIIFFRWTQLSDVPLLWPVGTSFADAAPLMATAIAVPPLLAAIRLVDPASALKDR